jgi:hypothetical protein
MSTFTRDGYQWRETYFVFFDRAHRPSLEKMEKLLHRLNKRFELKEGTADENGRLESISILSEGDYAAIDIAYEEGEEVQEQAAQLVKELKSPKMDPEERKQLERLSKCNGRFDLLHFEHMSAESPALSDEDDDMLDPSSLLLVLDQIVDLTKGVGIDPASGSLLI